MTERKPILCLDFDGVIHSYKSGWQGADVIPDQPVLGAMRFICEALQHFDVQVFSSRSHQEGGMEAMQRWLVHHMTIFLDHELTAQDVVANRIKWPTTKPPAMVTIDDRAITFDGEWPDIAGLLLFKPWNKK